MIHIATICPHCQTENHHHGNDCVKCHGSLDQAPGSVKPAGLAIAVNVRIGNRLWPTVDMHWKASPDQVSKLLECVNYIIAERPKKD